MNDSADVAANAASKGSTTSTSMPAAAISSRFCSSVVSSRGARSGCNTFRGCGSKVYTTAVDMQQSGAIVVVAKRPENQHGVIIGHFLLDGIKPESIGVPKIEVTLKLANEKTLHVAALYKNGKKTKQLTFASKGGPPIRTVAQASEAPQD